MELAEGGPDGEARCGKTVFFLRDTMGLIFMVPAGSCSLFTSRRQSSTRAGQGHCTLPGSSLNVKAWRLQKATGKHGSSIEHINSGGVKRLKRTICSRAERANTHLGNQPCLILDLVHVDPMDDANCDRSETTKSGLGDAVLLPAGPRCLAWAGPGFREEMVYCP